MCNHASPERADIVRLAWERSPNIGRREQARVLARLAERLSKAAGRLVAGTDSERGRPLRCCGAG